MGNAVGWVSNPGLALTADLEQLQWPQVEDETAARVGHVGFRQD